MRCDCILPVCRVASARPVLQYLHPGQERELRPKQARRLGAGRAVCRLLRAVAGRGVGPRRRRLSRPSQRGLGCGLPCGCEGSEVSWRIWGGDGEERDSQGERRIFDRRSCTIRDMRICFVAYRLFHVRMDVYTCLSLSSFTTIIFYPRDNSSGLLVVKSPFKQTKKTKIVSDSIFIRYVHVMYVWKGNLWFIPYLQSYLSPPSFSDSSAVCSAIGARLSTSTSLELLRRLASRPMPLPPPLPAEDMLCRDATPAPNSTDGTLWQTQTQINPAEITTQRNAIVRDVL